MTVCASCGQKNIAGVDVCDACGHALHDGAPPSPRTVLEQRILQDRIGGLPLRPPITVGPETTVADALSTMVSAKIGCCLVVEGTSLIGIFTERDALTRLGARYPELKSRPIREFMTPNPESLDIDAKIAFALHKMDLGGYRHIPVTQRGELRGVISIRDMLRYCRDHLTSGEG